MKLGRAELKLASRTIVQKLTLSLEHSPLVASASPQYGQESKLVCPQIHMHLN